MSKEVFPDDMGLAPYVDFAHPLSTVSYKVPPKLSAISSVFKTDPISGFKSCDHTAVAQKRDSVAISISERTPVASASTNRPSALTSRIRPSRPFALRL